MPPAAAPSCATCAFLVPGPVAGDTTPPHLAGECRRYPPGTSQVAAWPWPRVQPAWWCGEWAKKP